MNNLVIPQCRACDGERACRSISTVRSDTKLVELITVFEEILAPARAFTVRCDKEVRLSQDVPMLSSSILHKLLN